MKLMIVDDSNIIRSRIARSLDASSPIVRFSICQLTADAAGPQSAMTTAAISSVRCDHFRISSRTRPQKEYSSSTR